MSRTLTIVLNILVGLVALGGVVLVYVRDLSVNAHPPFQILGWTIDSIALIKLTLGVAIVSIVASHTGGPRMALFWALFVPLGFAAMLVGSISRSDNRKRESRVEYFEALHKKAVEHIFRFSRDYKCSLPRQRSMYPVSEEFLTVDKETHSLVSVVLLTPGSERKDMIVAHPIGVIRSSSLYVRDRVDETRKYYGECRDAKGKTIFDNYSVTYEPDQEIKDLKLEKYREYDL